MKFQTYVKDNEGSKSTQLIQQYIDKYGKNTPNGIINLINQHKPEENFVGLVLGVMEQNGFSDQEITKVANGVQGYPLIKKLTGLVKKIFSKKQKNPNVPAAPVTIGGSAGQFLNALGMRESSNDWTNYAPNSSAIGRYQFLRGTLRWLGLGHITKKAFIQDPNIFPPAEQDKAMVELLRRNYKTLRRYTGYIGKNINGVNITLSGMLAGAHLMGAGNVINFLRNGSGSSDANGTQITEYMKKFGGFDLSSILA